MADDEKMRFPNIYGDGVTLCTNGGHYSRDVRGWEFRGVYQKKEWIGPSNDYGFAATSGRDHFDEQDVSVGQFVRFYGNGTNNAFIKPMRCYLHYDPDITANAKATNGMAMATTSNEIPLSITVRLVNYNGETTDIGTLDTKTGEITLDGWYDLNGTSLGAKPTAKGVYINNGKKIAIE